MTKSSLLFLAALPVLADPYVRQPGIDARHYVFRLALSETTDEIQGEASIDFLFVRPNVTQIAMDLAAPMNVTAVEPGALTRDADRLLITLQAAPQPGEHRIFTVRYHGVPKSGLRIGNNKYGDRTYFGLNWPNLARQWLPMIDHPYDKATSEFVITAPAKYSVVANGLLVEEIDLGDGRRRTHWKQGAPIASWLNAIGVAQFASRHFGSAAGVPLQTWVYYQDRENGKTTFETPTRNAIEFFSSHIGPYPYEKLANVIAAGLNGGTEHASAIFYGERTIADRPATGLVAHEIAHQWFGDSVTEKDWDDVWLSEGFATYFTLLSTEHYEGRDAFVAGLKRSRDGIFRTQQQLPNNAVIHTNLPVDLRGVLNQLVYQKGGWVLHMLRGQVGTEKYWAGIREYYRLYRDGNAATDDFRRVMEEASGQQLGWFFEQWLRRAGYPTIEATWRYTNKIELDIAQTQAGEAYRLPMEISIAGKIQKIELTEKKQHFEFATDSAPASVTLDPNTWVLMNATLTR